MVRRGVRTRGGRRLRREYEPVGRLRGVGDRNCRRLNTKLLADVQRVVEELVERLLLVGVDGRDHAHAAVAGVGVGALLAVDPDRVFL